MPFWGEPAPGTHGKGIRMKVHREIGKKQFLGWVEDVGER